MGETHLHQKGGPLVCPNGHAMDEGLFHCPACGAYRPSANDPDALIEDGRVVGVMPREFEPDVFENRVDYYGSL